MRKSLSLILISFAIIFILISCSRKRDYEFVVNNKTAYKIISFSIGSGNEKVQVSLNPYTTSDIVTYHFGGTYFNFTEPLLGLGVDEYSDSINTYKNDIGRVTSIPELNKKSKNNIEISLKSTGSSNNDIFEIIVNE